MSTNTADTEATRGEPDEQSRPRRLGVTLADRCRDGTVPAVLGAVCLGAAVRARRDGRRWHRLAVAGAAALGLALRQRRLNAAATDEADDRADEGGSDDQVSADAKAHLEQSKVLHQGETNPRGVADEPDVETETDPDEGEIRFSTDRDEGAETKPNLEEADVEDPRYPDEDDPLTSEDHVDVDLSEAAMADEASEAAGPAPEQSYPAFEGTDPEPTSMAAPERGAEGAGTDTDSPDEGDATEDEEED